MDRPDQGEAMPEEPADVPYPMGRVQRVEYPDGSHRWGPLPYEHDLSRRLWEQAYTSRFRRLPSAL